MDTPASYTAPALFSQETLLSFFAMKPSRLETMCKVTLRLLAFPSLRDIVPPRFGRRRYALAGSHGQCFWPWAFAEIPYKPTVTKGRRGDTAATNSELQRRTALRTRRSIAASGRTSSDEADKMSVGSTVVSKDRISGAACGSAHVGMNRYDSNVVFRLAARRVIRPA